MKIIVLLLSLALAHYSAGYYWKEWNGSVPQFAVKAGRDNRGISYIAQAYVPNTGIYVGQVFQGQEEIYLNTALTSTGVAANVSSYDIKILCSDKDDLEWMSSNYTRTEDILARRDIHLIKGGVNNRNSTIYIGKYSDGVNTFIGSVHYIYFVFYSTPDHQGKTSYYYELLVSENGSTEFDLSEN